MSLSFGERLKLARKEKKLTQKELAKKLGVDHTTISHWESNKHEPGIENLKKLSVLFNNSIDNLTGNVEYTLNEQDLTRDIIENNMKLDEIRTKYDFDILNLSDDDLRGVIAYVRAAQAMKKE